MFKKFVKAALVAVGAVAAWKNRDTIAENAGKVCSKVSELAGKGASKCAEYASKNKEA